MIWKNKKFLKKISLDKENILEKNLVWIFGMHRSGTSWLAELLSYNTNIWDEPGIGDHLGKLPGFGETNMRTYERNQVRVNYFFNDKFKSIWLLYLKHLILVRINAEFPDTSKKIIIKEPNGSLGSDIIAESLPKSKIIVVQRDPRDVIDSVVDGMQEGGWRAKWRGYTLLPENRLTFIENEARVIVKTWEILWKTLEKHSNSHYLVKYEDLKKNTLQELEKLYHFIEIDIDKDSLEKIVDESKFEKIPDKQKGSGKSKRSATPGKWEVNFNNQEKTIMEKILSETVKKLGYD